MPKFQHRNLKQQGNTSALKPNSTSKDVNKNEEEEILIIELKK
jgi:hypothetical protein